MASISLVEKILSPQTSLSRAMMSGLTSLGVLAGGTRRANNFPALVISTGSPSAIHAATRGKRFRKSLTVAVFIVRQICITYPSLSTVFEDVRRVDFPRAIFCNGGADGGREGCLQAGAVTATRRASACRRETAGSRQRDNAAAGGHTRRCYL